MRTIATLTLNPAIDGAAEADLIRPIHKIRMSNERYDPGGGGINVARVVRELDGDAYPIYLAGGATGDVLDELLMAGGVSGRRVPIAGHTRISHAIFERSSGLEFRFVPDGPLVAEAEWQACLEAIKQLDCDYLVASGSLPRGIPDDFYAFIATICSRGNMKLVLDTSGEALRAALGQGLHLIKPSLGELEGLLDRKLSDPEAQDAAVSELIENGAAEMIALTLGSDGALLATKQSMLRLAAPKVEAKSAVGAGDSFLAAMTLGLAQGRLPDAAFAYGLAAGAATVLSAGTGLCRREDVERLYAEVLQGL